MTNNLLFDFTADKATNTIFVNREFAAELSLVWDAFTKQEILDQWGAPEPWTAQTISMKFKVGGRRFYKMVSREGQEHFSVQDFTSISPKTNFKYISGFSDKDENINPEFYGSQNNLDFSEANGFTTVRIAIKYTTLAVLEMMIEKGFKEGFTMTLDKLDKLLETISQK
ncbi:MAG: SRPBCC domain-containing protein [Bacteroidota bacterium]|nr:SRPBCC domain-containing protein [Bacteroidota bacterium]